MIVRLFPAEDFLKRLKELIWKLGGFSSERIQFLRELHLVAAMNFAWSGWHLIGRDVDFVGGAGRFAAGGREMIGLRANQRMLEGHGRLQIRRRINRGRF